MGRSLGVIRSLIKSPESYGTTKRTGRPKTITPVAQKWTPREALEINSSASGILKALKLSVKRRRARQPLEKALYARYKKIARTPAMKERHIRHCISWATEKMVWNQSRWHQTVCLDDKKFKLDGQNGFAYNWHELRNGKVWFSRRQNRGYSVMVWASFAGSEKCLLVFLAGKQNCEKYVGTMEYHLVPFSEDLPLTWLFMHDGAPCHRSIVPKTWLQGNSTRVLDCPANSPDLNQIENLWGILATSLYGNQRQFNDVETLTKCILTAWDIIESTTVRALMQSTKRCCLKAVYAKGSTMDY